MDKEKKDRNDEPGSSAVPAMVKTAHKQVCKEILGRSLPPTSVSVVINIVEAVAEELRSDAPHPTERIVCNVTGRLAGMAAQGAMMGEAFVTGAAAIPVTVPVHPGVRIINGIASVGITAPITSRVADEFQDSTRRLCLSAAATVRQQLTTAPQRAIVQHQAVQHQTSNLPSPPVPISQTISKTPLFNSSFQPRPSSFSSFYQPYNYGFSAIEAERAKESLLRDAERQLSYALSSKFGYVPYALYSRLQSDLRLSMSSYLTSQITSAFHSNLSCYSNFSFNNAPNYFTQSLSSSFMPGFSNFTSTLMINNLISSYNSYNPSSYIFGSWKYGRGEIGGVATEVATIKDLINSETQAEADDYYLCFPQTQHPFSDSLIDQIKAELANAYFNHKTLPFFSLHFNQHGVLYPVIHPAFQGTLIGNIIGLLDYWMKGFLNGGIFDEIFLKTWHETENCDETMLRSQMIDLKKYCKANRINYFSLRQLENQMGLAETKTNSAYNQPFMTSFRIISCQEKVQRHGNVLVPSPAFRVEYSVDLMPDYKEYVDSYLREHGSHPPEHEKMLLCYTRFAEEVKNTMPTLPFCRDYFHLLGVINSLCYFYVTLEKMGKQPVLNLPENQINYHFPKSLPPIPVHYYRSYPVEITFASLYSQLINSDENKTFFNTLFYDYFSSTQGFRFPERLDAMLEATISEQIRQQMATRLSPEELADLNDEAIHAIAAEMKQIFVGYSNHFSRQVRQLILNSLSQSGISLTKAIRLQFNNESLPGKIQMTKVLLEDHWNNLRARWELNPKEARKSIFNNIPKTEHKNIKNQLDFVAEVYTGAVEFIIEVEAGLAIKRQEIINLINQNKASVAGGIPGLDKQIQDLMTSAVNEKLEAIAQVDILTPALLTQLRQHIESFAAGFGQDLENRKLTLIQQGKDLAQKEVKNNALAILNQYSEALVSRKLENIQKNSQTFSLLLSGDILKNSTLCKSYTHCFVAFNVNKLNETSGQTFKISGGCGMSLPNIQSIPLEHADTFIASMAESIYLEEKDTVSFTHNNQQWLAYRIQVQEKPALASRSTINNPVEHTQNNDPLSSDAFGNSSIHLAAQTGNIELVNRLLASDPALSNLKNKDNMSAFMIATQAGHLAICQTLYAHGADVNFSMSNGLFPLYIALEKNRIDLAQWMLDSIPNLALDQIIDSKMTALHVAIENGATELAKQLIMKGARCDIARKSDGFTALHCAASAGLSELIETMKTRGLAIDTALESKKTPLHLAAQNGHLALVDYLIQQGLATGSQTIENETPLTLAIKSGQIATSELLAKHTPPNLTDSQDQTASVLAIIYGIPNVADNLIERGDDPELKDRQGYNYVYHLVRNGEYQRFCKLCINGQINPNQLIHGNSLLAIAAQQGHFLLVYALLDASAIYVSTTDKSLIDYAIIADEPGYLRDYSDNDIPLLSMAQLAARHASIHCLSWLVQQMPAITSQWPELLAAGIISNNEQTLNHLLKRCPDINLVLDKKGNRPLHLAVSRGAEKSAALLLTLGAHPQLRNQEGDSAFTLAAKRADAYLLKKLLKSTQPADWPSYDELNTLAPISKPMEHLLTKYKKRLPELATSSAEPQTSAKARLEPNLLLSPADTHYLDRFRELAAIGDFDSATTFLKRYPVILNIFRTKEGAQLFELIIKNISKHKIIDVNDEPEETSSTSNLASINGLLGLLAKKGINPGLYTEEYNPLLTMIYARGDKNACYQLSIFLQYFPQSITALLANIKTLEINLAEIAIKKDKLEFIKQIDKIRKKEDPEYCGLHEVVRSNHYQLTREFLEHYPVDMLNAENQTALMLAAKNGHKSIINLLLQHGAALTAIDQRGQNIIHYALHGEGELAAQILMPLLKKPNMPNRYGCTPLIIAASTGKMAILRLLLEAGHFIKRYDDNGQNALHHAAMTGQLDCINYLVNHGFDCDEPEHRVKPDKDARYKQRTALQLATLGGHVEAVLRLLELGADPLKTDAQGNSFIEYVVLGKNPRLLNLVKLTPWYHQLSRDTRLLHAAARANHIEVMAELILDDADLNAPNDQGFSALHLAVLCDSAEVIELMLTSDHLELNAVDSQGNTPLHHAALRANVRLIELLLRHGAGINEQNRAGDTPLHLACKNGHEGAIAALLKLNADRHIKNQEQQALLQPGDRSKNPGFFAISCRLPVSCATPHPQPFSP